MGILLILAQVALVVLDYGAHVLHLSPWIIFLPAMLFATILLIAHLLDVAFVIDRVQPFGAKRRR